jgi:hypothetical protein
MIDDGCRCESYYRYVCQACRGLVRPDKSLPARLRAFAEQSRGLLQATLLEAAAHVEIMGKVGSNGDE